MSETPSVPSLTQPDIITPRVTAALPEATSQTWGTYADTEGEVVTILGAEFARLVTDVHALFDQIQASIQARDALSKRVGYLKLAHTNAAQLTETMVYRPEIEIARIQKMREVASSYGDTMGLEGTVIQEIQSGIGIIGTLIMTRSRNIQLQLDSTAQEVAPHALGIAQGNDYYNRTLGVLGSSLELIDESTIEYILLMIQALIEYRDTLDDDKKNMLLKNQEDQTLEELFSEILTLAMRVSGHLPSLSAQQ